MMVIGDRSSQQCVKTTYWSSLGPIRPDNAPKRLEYSRHSHLSHSFLTFPTSVDAMLHWIASLFVRNTSCCEDHRGRVDNPCVSLNLNGSHLHSQHQQSSSVISQLQLLLLSSEVGSTFRDVQLPRDDSQFE
jgi:hypothetical protein